MGWLAAPVRGRAPLGGFARCTLRLFCSSCIAAQHTPPTLPISSLQGKVKPETYRALAEKPFRFSELTDVQSRVLSLLPELSFAGLVDTACPLPDQAGRDLLVKARTGTGKTVAFLVPALESRCRALEAAAQGAWPDAFRSFVQQSEPGLLTSDAPSAQRRLQELFRRRSVGVLILSPTRELATQIASEAKKLLLHHKQLNVHLLVGGNDKRVQREEWRKRSRDLVVATPGRLMDLLDDEQIRAPLSTVQTLILDEADMLLELGFREDIRAITRALPAPEKRSTMLFSATINPNIEAIARATLHPNHRYIDCVPEGEDVVHTRIPQFVTLVPRPEHMYPHILRLIARDQLVHGAQSKVMLFCATTKQTRTASAILDSVRAMLPFSKMTRVFEMHSDMQQPKRNRIARNYRECTRTPSVLVTSDVSARGVDYPGVTQVIQMGIPSSPEIYVHRVGRTGRGNSDGRADLVLMHWEDAFVTWDLQDMPLQLLPPEALADEMHARASAADAAAPRQPTGKRSAPARVHQESPVAPRLDTAALVHAVDTVRARMDHDVARGVFTSLVGFYASRAQTLRLHKGQLVEYLSDLAHATTAATKRPQLSPYMQRQLGIHPARPAARTQRSSFHGAERRRRPKH